MRGRDFRLRPRRSLSCGSRLRHSRPAAPAVMSAPRPPQPAPPAALLLFVLFALGARASDVVELTDADFESGLAERPGLVLVEFFAPW